MANHAIYRAIHGARRRLGLDEDTYRARLEMVTGKNSLRAMSGAELVAVRDSLYSPPSGRSGPSPAPPPMGHTKRLSGPYAKKLQALWLSGWNLGIFRDRRDQALLAFVERQTGLKRTEFLREAEAAQKVVEALKDILAREGGVNWSAHNNPQDAVIEAQLRLLGSEQVGIRVRGEKTEAVMGMAKIVGMQMMGEKIRARKSGEAR